jgi:hypothetical protein
MDTNTILQVKLIAEDKGWDVLNVISLLIAVGGFVFGFYQFFVSARLKRVEYLDALLKRLREEPLLKSATVLLDWDERPVTIGDHTFNYQSTMLAGALRDHHQMKDHEGFSNDETAIRDAMDALFDYLGSIQYAAELRTITQQDAFASPVAYYFGKLAEKDDLNSGAVTTYLAAYGFDRAGKLLSAYAQFQQHGHRCLFSE